MALYNYTSFPHDGDMPDFERFPDVARVGTKAPAIHAPLVEITTGDAVSLESYLRRGVTVIEFGSLT